MVIQVITVDVLQATVYQVIEVVTVSNLLMPAGVVVQFATDMVFSDWVDIIYFNGTFIPVVFVLVV